MNSEFGRAPRGADISDGSYGRAVDRCWSRMNRMLRNRPARSRGGSKCRSWMRNGKPPMIKRLMI